MATVLVPLPRQDFDPTETGVPWRVLTDAGHALVFATPDGAPALADPRMLHGTGLGLLAPMLRAQGNAVADHDRMVQSPAWRVPIPWGDIAFPSVHWALNHDREARRTGDFTARHAPPTDPAALQRE